jgi:hypothetical protein
VDAGDQSRSGYIAVHQRSRSRYGAPNAPKLWMGIPAAPHLCSATDSHQSCFVESAARGSSKGSVLDLPRCLEN